MRTIKTLVALLCLICISQITNAQKKNEAVEETTIISNEAVIERFHTIDELNALGKPDLIKLYNERFKVVILLLPYSALSNQPGSSLEALGIPVTSENKGLLRYEYKTGRDFYVGVEQCLQNFIAYADKSNIVWSIILFEDIIKKINLGKDY